MKFVATNYSEVERSRMKPAAVRKRNSSVTSLAPKTFLALIIALYSELGWRSCSKYCWTWVWLLDARLSVDAGMLYSFRGVSCVSLTCSASDNGLQIVKLNYWSQLHEDIN